jgi:hypothetical protein
MVRRQVSRNPLQLEVHLPFAFPTIPSCHVIATAKRHDSPREGCMVKHIPSIDRRSPNRLETPSCPRCGDATRVVGAIRTTDFVYFRCTACDELLVKSISGIRLPHGLIAKFLT